MSILVGVIGLAALLGLMTLGVPIAYCFGLVGFLGTAYFVGIGAANVTLALYSWSETVSYTMMALPLFILMGEFIDVSGFGADLFALFHAWLGRLKGGLAIATTAACAAFAACSGSSLSAVVTIGSTAYPEMRKYGYDKKLATGCIATAGTLAILIPPSGSFVIYSIITEVSLGKLLIAGILPGILLAVMLAGTVYLLCTLNPKLAPQAPSVTWTERYKSLLRGGVVVPLFLVVVGGIYLGWFSPTEAAAVGAFLTCLLAIMRKALSLRNLGRALFATIQVTCMILLIIIMATFYGHFIALTTIPVKTAAWVGALPLPPLAIMGVILLIYAVLGTVMDAVAMMVLTLPVFFPTVTAMGFDPIWFGVLVVMECELALITPPVGLAVYVVAGIAKDCSIQEVFSGIFPFAATTACAMLLLLFFPQIALFLPTTLR